jgi:hypothetical protein
MDGKLIFCKDGILRFQSDYDDEKTIPYVLIEEALNINPAKSLLQMLKRNSIIEAGSTLGSFVLCLEPWAEYVSDYVDRDVNSYIKAIRKPSDKKMAFDKIEIKQIFSLSRDLDFGKIPENVDFGEWLNTPKEPKILNTFEMEQYTSVCGYINGDPSNYSVSSNNIHEIKNVPLILNRKKHVTEYCGKLTESKGSVLNSKTEGVYSVENTLFLETKDENSFSFEVLLDAIFCDALFYETPNGADNLREILNESLSEIKSKQENNSDLVETPEQLTDNKNEPEDKPLKIEIYEDAFAPLVKHSVREQNEWDYLMDKIKINSRYPIKIGKIEEEKSQDNRLNALILDENNNLIKKIDY